MMKEYRETIEKINQTEIDHLNTRREYDKREFEILTSYDFKKKYGKDNDKIRNGHIKMVLHDLLLKKDSLELELDQLNRHKKLLELEISYGD